VSTVDVALVTRRSHDNAQEAVAPVAMVRQSPGVGREIETMHQLGDARAPFKRRNVFAGDRIARV
jgi:hypothetical protein